jgi:hypothetical protein
MSEWSRQVVAEALQAREQFETVLPGKVLGHAEAVAWVMGRYGLDPEHYLLVDAAVDRAPSTSPEGE